MAILNFEEDNIIINKCINNHNNKYYIGDIFMKDQYINELKCDICNNDKYLYNDNFYLCSCNKYICPLCINNIIKNIKKYFIKRKNQMKKKWLN